MRDAIAPGTSAMPDSHTEAGARLAATAALGAQAVAGEERAQLLERAVEAIATHLPVPCALVVEADSDPPGSTLRAAAGRELALLGGARFTDACFGDSRAPLVVADLARSPVPLPGVLARRGLRSLLSVPIASRERPFGWLAALDTEPREFDSPDVAWLQSLAHVLAAAIRRSEDEELLRHRALHDPLTGLPNRDVLRDELATALDRSAEGDVAVILCDLDDFKIVNDSLGHPTGDRLLVALARRLERAAREGDVVVRFGGDEFVIVTPAGGEDGARAAAQRLLETVAEPFSIDGREIFLRGSVGIAVSNGPDDDPARLIRDADAAMYRAKRSGCSPIQVFGRPMRAEVLAALDTEHALHRALARRELLLHYQPVVRLADGAVSGCEALIRWRRDNGSLQSPASFVPVAEKTGLVVEIGAWVLEQACRQLLAWRSRGVVGPEFVISVNVSARQLAAAHFVGGVERTIAATGIDPGALSLEITESALLEDPDHTFAVLDAIRSLGVGVSIDDFGTGYSSLSRLKHVPADVIKIDRSFVDGAGVDEWDTAIVGAVVGLAHVLDVEVVAEGVETAVQARLLESMGCELAQGFLFAHPTEPAAVEQLLPQRLGPLATAAL